jgi:hypothetical protein
VCAAPGTDVGTVSCRHRRRTNANADSRHRENTEKSKEQTKKHMENLFFVLF